MGFVDNRFSRMQGASWSESQAGQATFFQLVQKLVNFLLGFPKRLQVTGPGSYPSLDPSP